MVEVSSAKIIVNLKLASFLHKLDFRRLSLTFSREKTPTREISMHSLIFVTRSFVDLPYWILTFIFISVFATLRSNDRVPQATFPQNGSSKRDSILLQSRNK